MNTAYKIVLSGITAGTVLLGNASAQTTHSNDSTLNRQVSLEREYTPTIQDAAKVNTSPALYQPKKKQYKVNFEDSAFSFNFSSFPVGDTGSGDIQTEMDYSKHRGWLMLGAGMYKTLQGDLGYRIADAKRDRLDIFASHNSTGGNVKYLLKDSPIEKVEAKDMENSIDLKYRHSFNSLSWNLSGSFFNNSYNYYGNPYIFNYIKDFQVAEYEDLTDGWDLGKKQSINIWNVETSVQSKESARTNYTVGASYNRIDFKHGSDYSYHGIASHLVNAYANVAFPLANDFKWGVKGDIFHQSSEKADFIAEEDKESYHNLSVVKANPYIYYDGYNFLMALGVNFNQAWDFNDKTSLSPMLNILWNFDEKSKFYLAVTGGINRNDLVSTYRENKYIITGRRVAISQTPYDAQIGVSSGAIKGLEFDIFGGYKYTKDEHLYIPSRGHSWWATISDALYANMGTGHVGASLKTTAIPYTDLSVKATGYFYNLKEYSKESPTNEKTAWGLPSFTLNFNADFTFIPNMDLNLKYCYENGRKTWVDSQTVKMDAINELNAKAAYRILKWLSVYAEVDNLLNQRYERYYGYTLQGLNALGGVELKF
jgi:hypothetical protein